MELDPISRNPTRLPGKTVEEIESMTPAERLGRRHRGHRDSRAVRRTSVIVVTQDNLCFTRLCLESLLANSSRREMEVIVVDNGSGDGTPGYLESLSIATGRVRPILNRENEGFARANNQGLAASIGDDLILLNNDTIVPPGWDDRLARHLRDPEVGLVGPLTNRICNEAQVDTDYSTYGGMVEFADRVARDDPGDLSEMQMLAMFCLAMRRDVLERLGPIDERFGLGLFEDDDYSKRARAAGYRVVCARDAFVHHFGQASFGALEGGEYGRLWHRNRALFEEKWGVPWVPHSGRTVGYRALVEAIRVAARGEIAAGATVAVISKGDDDLLALGECRGRHFPDDNSGDHLGYHPANAPEVIRRLEESRRRGVEYLLIPSPQFWYLDFFAGFRTHLERHYPPPSHFPGTCIIFDLRVPASGISIKGI